MKIYLQNSLIRNYRQNSSYSSSQISKAEDKKDFFVTKQPSFKGFESSTSELSSKAENLLEAIARNTSLRSNRWYSSSADIINKVELDLTKAGSIFKISDITSPDIIKSYLKLHPDLDINSKNEAGDTILTNAISNYDVATVKTLSKMDDVDWYARNGNGEHIVKVLLENFRRHPMNVNQIFEVLRSLPESKFDINKFLFNGIGKDYDKECRPVLEAAMNGDYIYALNDVLKFKNLNPNVSEIGIPPVLSWNTEVEPPSLVLKIINHPNFDPKTKYRDEEVGKTLNRLFMYHYEPHYTSNGNYYDKYNDRLTHFIKALEVAYSRTRLKTVRNIYDEVGFLTLEQIKEFIETPNSENFINESINCIDENVAHLLAETPIAYSNPEQVNLLSDIVKKLVEKDFDFTKEDSIGRTPLMIATEAENIHFIELLLNSKVKLGNLNKVLEIAKNSNNDELKNLFLR